MSESAPVDQKAQLTFRTVGLTKVYGEGATAVHALRGVDLEVAPGELIVLLGPSGSGKSTLLNIIGGLDRPTAGEMFFSRARHHEIVGRTTHRIQAKACGVHLSVLQPGAVTDCF